MSTLRPAEDLLAQVAQGLLDLDDLPSFRAGLLSQLRRLVDCDHTSYNEIAPAVGEAFVLTDPIDTSINPEQMREFSTLVLQNPLAAHYLRTGDSRTLRLSDFMARDKLHALELYDVVYKQVGTEYQLAFTLPSDEQLIGITFNRQAQDFDDAEIALLDRVRQMVILTYRNLHDRARLEAVTSALDAEPRETQSPLAVLTVEAHGLLVPAHERAERLLRRIASEHATLDALHAWAHEQRRARLSSSAPLRIECGAEELEARYLHCRPGAVDAVVVRCLAIGSPYALCALGLTHRQAEVLQMVQEGATNAEIAVGLCISAHTVRHHLEDVYRRLGVKTRAAAAHLANQTLADIARLPA
ncbi:MAG TPA: helix-turn-helix transcriptional regulator [Solirubrobacteraceae bacterium]|jgi:DNA-binding CsgD family transcriptional regulator